MKEKEALHEDLMKQWLLGNGTAIRKSMQKSAGSGSMALTKTALRQLVGLLAWARGWRSHGGVAASWKEEYLVR